jgi:hypothetical protein
MDNFEWIKGYGDRFPAPPWRDHRKLLAHSPDVTQAQAQPNPAAKLHQAATFQIASRVSRLRGSAASEPRDRSAPTKRREGACRGVRGAKPLG